MMMLIRSAYDWWIAKLRAIRHSKPPEPPMRLRLHEAGSCGGRLSVRIHATRNHAAGGRYRRDQPAVRHRYGR